MAILKNWCCARGLTLSLSIISIIFLFPVSHRKRKLRRHGNFRIQLYICFRKSCVQSLLAPFFLITSQCPFLDFFLDSILYTHLHLLRCTHLYLIAKQTYIRENIRFSFVCLESQSPRLTYFPSPSILMTIPWSHFYFQLNNTLCQLYTIVSLSIKMAAVFFKVMKQLTLKPALV